MKNLTILIGMVLLASSVLAGCKSEPDTGTVQQQVQTQTGQQDGAPPVTDTAPDTSPDNAQDAPENTDDQTVSELMKANDILSLLSKHDSVTLKMESYFEDGTLDTASTFEFFNTPSGVCTVQRIESSIVAGGSAMYGYIGEGVTGVIFNDTDFEVEEEEGADRTLTLCPSKDYPYLATQNNSSFDYSSMGGVTVSEGTEDKDGKRVVSTKTTIPDMPFYERNVYTVDPKSNKMYEKDTTSYDTTDDSVQWSTHTVASYDAPHGEIDAALLNSYINAGDGCALTLTVNPGSADEEVQCYTVPRDCMVFFQSKDGNYMLYSDPQCTKRIDYIDVSGDTCEIYASDAVG